MRGEGAWSREHGDEGGGAQEATSVLPHVIVSPIVLNTCEASSAQCSGLST